MGFTFDDTDKKGVASRLGEMHRLIEEDHSSRKVIRPYIGGEEVNTSPRHSHHRYVIDFGERSEAECRMLWPALLRIVEEKVKPSRLASAERSRSGHGRRASAMWWQFMHHAKDLYSVTEGLERVLVNSQVSKIVQFAFLRSNQVFAHTLNVYPYQTYAAFCTLQARPHEIWARFFGSSMKDDLRYTPSDCFETFPFPEGWETHPALEAAGKLYYESRAALMVEYGNGMTKTYNRFHDIYETDQRIVALRELHGTMDRAVLDAYGWTDIPNELRIPPRLRNRRGQLGPQEEALPLSLARCRPRRGSCSPSRSQRRTRCGRGRSRCPPTYAEDEAGRQGQVNGRRVAYAQDSVRSRYDSEYSE